MPDDDDAITVDTRRGGSKLPRPRRRPAEEPQQIPVRAPSRAAGPLPRARGPQQPAGTGSRPGSTAAPTGGAGQAAPAYDSTRVMPARAAGYPGDAAAGRTAVSDRTGPGADRRPGPRGPRPPRCPDGAGPGGPGAGPGGPGAGPGGPGARPDPRQQTRRPRRKRTWLRVVTVLVLIVALWVGLLAWAGLSAWGKVAKVDAFPSGERPAAGKGTNVVLVGSDSRAGLSSQQAKALRTGGTNVSAGAAHTDSIMILHLPDSGSPTLVSVPRDSWVAIPGHGHGKINAAFTYGGPQLLVQTVEQATGLRIDDYMEIGFGGFAGVVDSVGGVRMCLPEAVKDDYAHINLPAGCQNLSGANALGYVRSRHAFAGGDLARAQHQREFLGALMKKVASPGNLLVPWRLKSVGESGAAGIAVNKGMSPITALKIMWTLKGITSGGQSVQVPIANPNFYVDGQSTVEWDRTRATQLFNALRTDGPVSVSQSSAS